MDLTKLSLKEKVGQKFMFGVNSHNIDIIINLIKEHCIGGVILYKKIIVIMMKCYQLLKE